MKEVILEKNGSLEDFNKLFEAMNEKGRFILGVSKESKNKASRYSYIGENAEFYLKLDGEKLSILNSDFSFNSYSNLDFFELCRKKLRYKLKDSKFDFSGGFIGYISYDMAKVYEKNLFSENEDIIKTPKAFLGFYKNFIVYDNETNVISLVYIANDSEDEMQIKKQLEKYYMNLSGKKIAKINQENNELIKFKSNYTKKEFCDLVHKAKKYIEEGDIFQVVLSQQIEANTNKKAFDIYKQLMKINLSPYMYCLNFNGFDVVGSSPEILVSLKNRKCVTNPIAGTIKRNEVKDKDLIEILRNDKKEIAEHMMLLDLGRNDLGKVSKIGSVKIDEFMKGEIFSHVIHLCSKVSSILNDDLDSIDLLKAILPAGTVSGAPKYRAMQIIEEMENRKRGIYAGAIGYFSLNGNMDMAIAIRTIILKNKKAYLQAGAGVVFDSVAEKEYEESLNKVKVLMEAIR